MLNNLALKPWPQPYEWQDWLAHLKTDLARMVAPWGKQCMLWLSKTFMLEDSANPVPDIELEDSGVFPRLDIILSQENFKCAEKGCTAFFENEEFTRIPP